jgi:hypothetical protein
MESREEAIAAKKKNIVRERKLATRQTDTQTRREVRQQHRTHQFDTPLGADEIGLVVFSELTSHTRQS